MILVGQYDSPFVRRVGLALVHYDLPLTHNPLSAFGDADALGRLNPLMRVPVLVPDDGAALVDSAAILDHLDSLAPPDRRLVPATGPGRQRILQAAALATGTADKAVTLFYLRRTPGGAGSDWAARIARQIGGGLDALEDALGGGVALFSAPNHADIALACVWRFLAEALPDCLGHHPGLAAHSARAEATPAFGRISQPFVAPG